MKIKKLIVNAEDHIQFAWSIMSWRVLDNPEVWRKEDLEATKLYIDYLNRNKYKKHADQERMTADEAQSKEHFDLCKKLYVDYLTQLKELVHEFECDKLSDFLFIKTVDHDDDWYDQDDDGNQLDEDGNIVPQKTEEYMIPLDDIEYPFIFTGEIGWNDVTENLTLFSDKVGLKDFLDDKLLIT